MTQLPFEQFDPVRMTGPESTEPAPRARREQARYGSLVEAKQLTVSQLSRLIDETLKDRIPAPIRVVGEISGFRERTHWYFDIKDEEAVLSCVAFANVARRAGFLPQNGMEVLISGRVEHYARQGKTQIYAQSIQPIGAGALEIAFRRLCEELRGKGYFDPARKRSLPAFPRRIAVVTSRSGAALQDVLDTMRRRCPAVGVALVDVRVQGEQAAEEIAAALRRLSERHERYGIDAILLTRGGGSMEDLWAFNERILADAVFDCTIPIVAAIGHETDTTIAELVADERAATPTQAAMRLTPDREALHEQVVQLARRLRRGLTMHVRHERQRLLAAARHAAFTDPRRRLSQATREVHRLSGGLAAALRRAAGQASERLRRNERRLCARDPQRFVAALDQQLEHQHARLLAAQNRAVAQRGERLRSLQRQLEIAGPMSVLRRGYSCTSDEAGNLLRSAQQVKAGQRILTRLADGQFASIVDQQGARQQSDKAPTGGRAASKDPNPPQSSACPDHPQMDLFGPLE